LGRLPVSITALGKRHHPDALSTILQAVVKLPKHRQDAFSGLLQKTELGNIISASSMDTDRVVAIEVSAELGTKPGRGRIRKPDGRVGRVDSFLGRSIPQPDQIRREFLLVELKRPSLKVGRVELLRIALAPSVRPISRSFCLSPR